MSDLEVVWKYGTSPLCPSSTASFVSQRADGKSHLSSCTLCHCGKDGAAVTIPWAPGSWALAQRCPTSVLGEARAMAHPARHAGHAQPWSALTRSPSSWDTVSTEMTIKQLRLSNSLSASILFSSFFFSFLLSRILFMGKTRAPAGGHFKVKASRSSPCKGALLKLG